MRIDNTKSEHQLSLMDWRELETFSFGDSPDLANSLLELVLSGRKRATCWAESQGLLSAELGKMMVVLDGQGVPKAVLKTIELTKRRFDEVDEAFAYDEGEGDRSLQYWREAHRRYFTRLGQYAPDMMLWCERFELVERIRATDVVE
ncbi:ASCH domain-containing protein [Bradyrhizobium sp. STM 3557]|uniref:ASCH domain-containing protein n=1 Tax=Bradyrhizobium sp. STM 3557 TaxID=578920 RepID=UPI00388F4932